EFRRVLFRSPVLLRCVSGDEQGGAELLRDGAPRRHPEKHHRHAADARGAVRLPRLPRVRRKARRAVCPRQVTRTWSADGANRYSTPSRRRTPCTVLRRHVRLPPTATSSMRLATVVATRRSRPRPMVSLCP